MSPEMLQSVGTVLPDAIAESEDVSYAEQTSSDAREPQAAAGDMTCNHTIAASSGHPASGTGSTDSKAEAGSDTPPGPDRLAVEESEEGRLERLGRQRPEVFKSIYSEIVFVFSISMSQILSVRVNRFLSSYLTTNSPRNTLSQASPSSSPRSSMNFPFPPHLPLGPQVPFL